MTPDLFFEVTAEGELMVLAPTHFETSARNLAIAEQLGSWTRHDDRGVAWD